MSRSKFYTSLAVFILSLSPIIQAKASKPAPLPSSSVISSGLATSSTSSCASTKVNAKASVNMNSPLLQKELHPLWMQMDIQEAPALMQALLEQAKREITEICQLKPEEMNFENTFAALVKAYDAPSRCYTSISQLSIISNSPELRIVREKIAMAATTFNSFCINNKALSEKLKIAATQDWVSTLSPARKHNIQTTLDHLKSNGSELEAAQQKRHLEIVKELKIQQFKFAQNARKAQDYHLNEPIVHRIAQLRQELAQLLGFENFASYKTKQLMIESEPNMRRLIKGMIAQLKPAFDKESSELLAFISEKKGEKITQIAPWERYYYMNLLKNQRFQFNENELSAYFPHKQVIQGMFRIFEQSFHIRIEEKASHCPQKGEKTPPNMAEVWHPDVKVFDVFDAGSNKHLGSFYIDLFHRDEKQAGAWVKPIRIANLATNGRTHLAALICNANSKSTQFQHIEVQMLFHEMGHILHILLNETELRSQSASEVAIDFIEFPSQLTQHYTWSAEVLDIIARHHVTGAKIPDEMKQKLMRSQHFMPAIDNMYLLALTLLDLELHSQYDKLFKGKNIAEASDIILKDMRLPYSKKPPTALLSLTACYNDRYASGYYSYMWGKILASDAFSRFIKDGVLNPNTGKHFRECVLSKGASAPAMELFKNFMGREPNIDALLEQQGILPTTTAKSSASAEARANDRTKASFNMNSPLRLKELYPLWMQMDTTEAPALMQELIEQAEGQIAEICKLKPEEMNYANTFGAIEKSQYAIQSCYRSISHLSNNTDSRKLRKVLKEITMATSSYQSSCINNVALWQNLKLAAAEDWVSSLSPAKKRYIQRGLESIQDSGAELTQEKKMRRQEIIKELRMLQLKFAQNIQDSQSPSIIINDPAKLAGMNPSWMDAAAKRAQNSWYGSKEKPQWLIGSYKDILIHCDHEATRRTCWLAMCQFGKINEPLVYRIAELRQELAQLLGFESFASFQTKRRMLAGEPKVRCFIEGMIAQVKPAFDKEKAELLAFISEKKGEEVTEIAPWEQQYYLNLLKEEIFQFSTVTLRDYFPHEQVTQGMFHIFEQLLDIRFKEKASYFPKKGEQTPPDMAELWHPDVKVFEVFDASSNKHLGSFYMDIFRRNNKRSGAWMMPLRLGGSGSNGQPYIPHLAALCCNFTRPDKGKQSLLSHREVQILFHEMGHILHHILSETELRSQAGIQGAWDFVEFPSQLAAYWTWTPEVLDIIARHYKTGARIPDEIKKQLLLTQHSMPAMANMEQLSLALIDLELHSEYDQLFKGKSIDEAADIILKDMRLPFSEKIYVSMLRLTAIISGGYESGYYSYKWGKALSTDAFSRFLKDGVLNPNTGKHLRESILSKGDSAAAMELFKNFMGREPNIDALLEQQGILPAKEEK